jgi:hypothetical protein
MGGVARSHRCLVHPAQMPVAAFPKRAPGGGAAFESVNFDFRAQNHEIMKEYTEIGA